MKRHLVPLIGALFALGLTAERGETARVQVVASIPDLKALTEAVGGDRVEVDTLARGTQNPHDIEVRPSLMLKLRRADLLVRNGAGGDPWVEPLLLGAQNSRILPGTPGYVDASHGVAIIPPSGPVDRSRGDVHPEGNPHDTLDPATATVITQNIVDGLARVVPAQAEQFVARRRDFLTQLDAALARWQRSLEPARGQKVVTYHETFTYFLRRFGVEQAGIIEDRPGIPPSPTHLANLIRKIREQQIRAIMAESFADQKVVALLARESGARAVTAPASVGGVKGVETYMDLFEHLTRTLVEAFR